MSKEAELKIAIDNLVRVINGLTKEEMRNLGYNWNEATALEDLKLTFTPNDFVSGTVKNRN